MQSWTSTGEQEVVERALDVIMAEARIVRGDAPRRWMGGFEDGKRRQWRA